ncbi:MAG: hypothetical protein ACE5H1_11175 [Thermodesulfobacteriota bacterium]
MEQDPNLEIIKTKLQAGYYSEKEKTELLLYFLGVTQGLLLKVDAIEKEISK